MAEKTNAVLWCVNIHGPDDVIAVGSYLDAVKVAKAFNDWWLKLRTEKPLDERLDPRMWAVPIEWPHDAEAHAISLMAGSPEYDGFIQAALPSLKQRWLVAKAASVAIHRERDALLAVTDARFKAVEEALDAIEIEIENADCVTCVACSNPIFKGDRYLGGETITCVECSPTAALLLVEGEGWVDADGEPLTLEARLAWYDRFIAEGGKPTDSLAVHVW